MDTHGKFYLWISGLSQPEPPMGRKSREDSLLGFDRTCPVISKFFIGLCLLCGGGVVPAPVF